MYHNRSIFTGIWKTSESVVLDQIICFFLCHSLFHQAFCALVVLVDHMVAIAGHPNYGFLILLGCVSEIDQILVLVLQFFNVNH